MTSEKEKMRDTKTLSREKAYPIILKFAKSFFNHGKTFHIRHSQARGYVFFSPSTSSHSEEMTQADYEKVLTIFEDPPFNTALRRAYDRQDMEAFETMVKDAVYQNFPPFEQT